MTQPNPLKIKIPRVFAPLAEPHRYKNFYGGRGGAKSWAFARMLVGLGTSRKIRILCAREYQSSIKESVHQLLSSQIDLLGLNQYYTIQRDSIYSTSGAEFIFKGLHFNSTEIKSLEAIDVCWVEEAQAISSDTWEYLIPTIRKENSEIWLSWNPDESNDATYKRFIENPPDDCLSVKVGWQDNPYFPEVLNKERLYLQRVDPEAYDHVWEGNPRSISDACIFKGKFVIEEFETPFDARFYHGSDFGFSNDPTTLIRSFIVGNDLFIDHEAYGVGVDINEIPELFNEVPSYLNWKIKADCSRPETISYLKKQHKLKIEPCKKWGGSVEDGISFIRKFEKVHIHQRCKHTAQEFKDYSYKKDKVSGEILPIIIDANNHCIDALRYGLDDKIKSKGIDWAAFVG